MKSTIIGFPPWIERTFSPSDDQRKAIDPSGATARDAGDAVAARGNESVPVVDDE